MDVRCFSSPRDRRLSLCSASAARHPRRNSLLLPSHAKANAKAKAANPPARRTLRHHPLPTRVTNHHASLPTTTTVTATASLISLSLYQVCPALLCARPHAARHPHSLSLSRSCLSTSLAHSTAAADLLKNRVLHSLSASAAFAPAARQASSHADILSPQLTSLIGTSHPRYLLFPSPTSRPCKFTI